MSQGHFQYLERHFLDVKWRKKESAVLRALVQAFRE